MGTSMQAMRAQTLNRGWLPPWTLAPGAGEARGGAREQAIQGLRGVAATLVFLNHFGFVFGASLGKWPSAFFGSLSFLSLGSSTFVVIAAYFTYRRFACGSDTSMAAYLKRRLYRILPLYWAVLLGYALFAIAVGVESKVPTHPRHAAGVLLSNFTLTSPLFGVPQIIVSTWTLTFIVLVYLLVPAFVAVERAFSPGRWIGMIPIAFAAVSICIAAFTRYATFGAIMAAGVLLYKAHQTARFKRFVSGVGDGGATVALVCFAALFRITAVYASTSEWARYARVPAQVLFVAAIALFVASRFQSHGIVNRMLLTRFWQWVGRMSYSHYLAHGIALYCCKWVIRELFGSGLFSPLMLSAAIPCCYAATLGAAVIVYRSLEVPLQQFAMERTAGTPAAAPVARARAAAAAR